MRSLKALGLLALASFPNIGYSLDLDYYTYDGFAETVNAFTRIAIIFNDQQYLGLFAVAAIFGIMYGGISVFGKALISGGQDNSFNLSWLFGVIIGAAIYQGLVIPKGTVHIYDPVKNDYRAVGNVPDLLILISGAWNKIERIAVEVVDASSAYPYANEAGGISFELLYSAIKNSAELENYYVKKSVERYYTDCSQMALTLPSYNFDLNQLRSGTNDLFNLLGNLRSPTDYTLYFDTANKQGVSVSCTEAWDNYLRPTLADAALYGPLINSTCTQAGYNVASPPQLARCQDALARLNTTIYQVNADHIHLMRFGLLSNALAESLTSLNPDDGIKTIVNRNVMVDGIATSITADEWLPSIRSVVFTLVLGIMPVLICFFVTPLVWKAMFLMFGLFAWVALWGVADAIAHGMAMDQAIAAAEEIRRHNMGITAALLSPEAAMKAMALFGKARSMGITLSTIVCAGIFGFSGYALSGMASAWQSSIDSKGTDAGNTAATPEGHSQMLRSLQQGYGTEYTTQMQGHQAVSDSYALEQSTNVATSNAVIQGAGGIQQAASLQGVISAGAQLASMSAMQQMAARNGLNPHSMSDIGSMAQQISEIENLQKAGNALGADQAAREAGFADAAEFQQFQSYHQQFRSYGDTSSLYAMKEIMQNELRMKLSDNEFYDNVANYQLASLQGDIKATGGNSETLTEFMKNNRSLSLGQIQGMVKIAAQNGMSLEQLGAVEGQFRALTAAGNQEALDNIAPQDIAAGYMANAMRSASSGAAIRELTSNYEGGITQYFKDIGESDTAGEFGRMLAFTQAAETMGLEKTEFAGRQGSAGMTFAVTTDDIPRLLEQGMIDEQSAALLERDGGGVITATFNPENGDSLTATTRTGDSIVSDRSYTDNASTNINSSYNRDLGTNVGPNSVAAMSLNTKLTEELSEHLRHTEENVDARENFIMAGAAFLQQITSSSVQENYQSQLSGGIETSLGTGTDGLLKFSIGGRGGQSWSGSDIESDIHSVQYNTYRDLYENSMLSAESLTRDEVNRRSNEQLRNTGTAMTFDEMEAKYDELYHDVWAREFQSGAETVLEHYKEMNANFTQDSEIAEDVKIKLDDDDKPAPRTRRR